jgi:glycosyltransferase involved in cell wall biosynthesis
MGVTARPRIAIVAPSLEILGGQSVLARQMHDDLRRDGFDVMFVAVNPRLWRPFRWIRRVPVLRTIVNQILYLPTLLRLARADVVHAFSASYWSFLLAPVPALVMGKVFGRRTILNYHSGEADDHLRNWGRLVHPWLAFADEIVVPSHYLAAVFRTHGYDTRVIVNAADLSGYTYRERHPLGRHVISVRNLEPHYRVDVIVRAFAAVAEDLPDAMLTVIGTGSEYARLRQLAAELNLHRVRFVGRVEPQEMPRLYDEADVFVNASVVDNQPVSILEAFAAGVPVVTTPTGDIAAMVRHDETGVIVPGPDPAAFAEAIVDLLRDEPRARALARAARRELPRYDWRAVAESWHAAYTGTPAGAAAHASGDTRRAAGTSASAVRHAAANRTARAVKTVAAVGAPTLQGRRGAGRP